MRYLHFEFFLVIVLFFYSFIQFGSAYAQTTSKVKKAIFAGGCFWCMEKPFEEIDGVLSVTSGYTGGSSENPTYENYGKGGHIEAIEIIYDPQKVSFVNLLDVFWRQIDPTDDGGQFVDRGHSYTTAIFYVDDDQKFKAEESKKSLEESGKFSKPIVTPVLAAEIFYPAEDYHQDYYKRNPIRYKYYRYGSGRDKFLDRTWGKDRKNTKVNKEDLRNKLTSMQYDVTQKNVTEPPFDNEYWNNNESGIYVDIVSGEPLFSSSDKYKSGTGWPSFFKPLVADNIIEKEDRKLFSIRTEVRSKQADSHLGHVFDDGPAPTGLRYCINSAALRFVPVEELEKQGYKKYLDLFKE